MSFAGSRYKAIILVCSNIDILHDIFMFSNVTMIVGMNFGWITSKKFLIAEVDYKERMDNLAAKLNCLDIPRT